VINNEEEAGEELELPEEVAVAPIATIENSEIIAEEVEEENAGS
jgi:hypothetical protein